MANEQIKITGSVQVTLTGPDGKVKAAHTNPNLVVTVGKDFLAAWLTEDTQSTKFMNYVALGTSNTAASAGQTALVAELSGGGYSRVDGSLTSAANVWVNTATFNPGNGTGTLQEVGLFSASTSGTMFARQVFGPYGKAAGDTLSIVWSLTLA